MFVIPKPFQDVVRNPQWTKDIKALPEKIGLGEHTLIFNFKHNIEAMFYTDFTVYNTIPGAEQLKKLQEKGWRIIINDDGNVPLKTKRLKGIEFLPLSPSPDKK